MPRIFIVLFSLFFAAQSPALAQIRGGNDLGGIFEDIFGGGGSGHIQNQVERVPVEVLFDQQNLPADRTGYMLVITGIAPPPPNVRQAAPTVLGESRTALAAMQSPIYLDLSVPRAATAPLPYLEVSARILDGDGRVVLENNSIAEYRGYGPAVLTLEPVLGAIPPANTPTNPSTNPAPNPSPPPQGVPVTVSGQVHLGSGQTIFPGTTLHVHLIEESLAGTSGTGGGKTVISKTSFNLDRETLPLDFNLNRVYLPQNGAPLALEAWTEDWAGRRNFATLSPEGYINPNTAHILYLEPAIQGAPLAPITDALVDINGQAQFNAYKGLPKGSVLIVTLERLGDTGFPQTITESRKVLDGLSGNIGFNLSAPQSALSSSTGNAPTVRARVETSTGTIMFSNPGGTPLLTGFNAVSLLAAPGY